MSKIHDVNNCQIIGCELCNKLEDMKPDLNKPAFKLLFLEKAQAIWQGNCPTCGEPIDARDFDGALSLQEFKISGMCQKCQDEVFGGEE